MKTYCESFKTTFPVKVSIYVKSTYYALLQSQFKFSCLNDFFKNIFYIVAEVLTDI